MQHCCKFEPTEIYFLVENSIYSNRTLSFGYCPICSKPVAELKEWSFDGKLCTIKKAGKTVNNFIMRYKNEIEYSSSGVNYLKFKSKPFGWRYGVNKSYKIIRQYAKDFYGNKELIKTIQ